MLPFVLKKIQRIKSIISKVYIFTYMSKYKICLI